MHPDTEPRPAAPIAPDLVLLPSSASLDASEAPAHLGGPTVLGLDLLQRTVMAARRAGYGRVFTAEFLNKTTPGKDYSYPYMLIEYVF